MPDTVGDLARGAAGDLVRVGLRRPGRPSLGQEQPPVDRRKGVLRGQVLGVSPGTLYNHIPNLRELRADALPRQLDAPSK
ncbi:hypothetical protein ACFVYE_40815 [Streptomyces sp. NPDC058239]|uniref:hypothetical protein n=1 Tax=unclassified Streptomyces TaxID=2593676 RepID=UPI0036668A96